MSSRAIHGHLVANAVAPGIILAHEAGELAAELGQPLEATVFVLTAVPGVDGLAELGNGWDRAEAYALAFGLVAVAASAGDLEAALAALRRFPPGTSRPIHERAVEILEGALERARKAGR